MMLCAHVLFRLATAGIIGQNPEILLGGIHMDSLDNLKKTPLYQRHIDLGGKMVDFGGWALPVQYASHLSK